MKIQSTGRSRVNKEGNMQKVEMNNGIEMPILQPLVSWEKNQGTKAHPFLINAGTILSIN